MHFWNRIEQFFKKRYAKGLERFFGRAPLGPEDVDFATIHRILIIRQHDMLGDFLLATPVLRAVRETFPHAHIGVVAREYFADIARHIRFVDEVLLFYKNGYHWTPRALGAFWRRLGSGWDLAVVLNTVSHSLSSDLIAHFSRARFVLGSEIKPLPGASRNFFYNLIAPYAPEEKHQTHRNLDIVRYLGIDTTDVAETMHLAEADLAMATAGLRAQGVPPGPAIGMHLGAGKPDNRWPVARFVALGRELVQEFGVQLLVFRGPGEDALIEHFAAAADFAFVRIAPCDLIRLAALFACCDAVVCNDTGVMHLAAATGTPLVAVFGPTDPALWKPPGEKFIAIRGADARTASVGAAEVKRALQALLRDRLCRPRPASARQE